MSDKSLIDLTWIIEPEDEEIDGVIDCLRGKNWIRDMSISGGIELPYYLYQDGSSMRRDYLEPYGKGPVSWVIAGAESLPPQQSAPTTTQEVNP